MSLPPSINSLDLTGSDALALAWDDIRKSLRQSIGARSFDHWLKPVALAGWLAEEGMVRLSLPSEFMASWVR